MLVVCWPTMATVPGKYDVLLTDEDAHTTVRMRNQASYTVPAGKAGWSLRRVRYDEFGNVVDESFFDGAHEPVVPKDLSYSSMKRASRSPPFIRPARAPALSRPRSSMLSPRPRAWPPWSA